MLNCEICHFALRKRSKNPKNHRKSRMKSMDKNGLFYNITGYYEKRNQIVIL